MIIIIIKSDGEHVCKMYLLLFPGPSSGKRTGGKSGSNVVAWAVPVAIVGVLLIFALVFFIHRSRRLEHSMYALLSMNHGESEGVTFHSGANTPLTVFNIAIWTLAFWSLDVFEPRRCGVSGGCA